MGRLDVICAHIPACRVFADVGCDHGYCTRYALQNGLCERAYPCDVSAACLKKAEELLREEIAAGRCFPVCCDGLDGLTEEPDCVLIAGMGGEEIVSILSRRERLPAKFVLQPMKNAEKVRAFLCARGAGIGEDMTFRDGKFYDLITGSREGGTVYSAFELRYGRDNLLNPTRDFFGKIQKDAETVRFALRAAEGAQRETLIERLHELEGIADAIDERL